MYPYVLLIYQLKEMIFYMQGDEIINLYLSSDSQDWPSLAILLLFPTLQPIEL